MPKLETLVARPVAQPGVGRAPDVSSGYEIVGRGLGQLADITSKVVDADNTSKTRRASAAAERELYDIADEINNGADYDGAEELFEKRSKEVMDRYRAELPGQFYAEAFDENTGAFNERLRFGVRANVRTKRVDAAKAGLDDELAIRAGLYADQWADAAGRDLQANTFAQSIDIQRDAGLITEREAVDYKQTFTAMAEKALGGKMQKVRTHHRVLEVIASTDNRAEALDLADKSDPDIAEDVFKRVKARFDALDKSEGEILRTEMDTHYPALDDAFTRGFRYGPGEHDVTPPGPEAGFAYVTSLGTSVTDKARKMLEGRVADMSRQHDLVERDVFAREYDALVAMRNDPKRRTEFLEPDMLEKKRLQFPNYRTQIDALIADRKSMLEGHEPTATETKRATELYGEVFDVRLTAGGQAEFQKDKERLARFRLHYEIAYQERSKTLGRRLDRDEERKLASELVQPLEGEKRYRFELPPRRAPTSGRRPAAPGQPAPAKLPPQPSQAQPYTDVDENINLALQAEMALLKRGEKPTSANVVAEMNKLRGAARE